MLNRKKTAYVTAKSALVADLQLPIATTLSSKAFQPMATSTSLANTNGRSCKPLIPCGLQRIFNQ